MIIRKGIDLETFLKILYGRTNTMTRRGRALHAKLIRKYAVGMKYKLN